MRSDRDATSCRWLGGVAMLIITIGVPGAVDVATDGAQRSVAVTGGIAGLVSAIVVVALVAPLVGHRRRYALLMLVPFWNLEISWRFGVALAELGQQRRGHPAAAALQPPA